MAELAAFTAIQERDVQCPVRVVGSDGCPVEEVDEFLGELHRRDCSAYTLRSYAVGLAHFLSWLRGADIVVNAVTRATVRAYIDDFRLTPKAGACVLDLARAGQVNLLTRKAYPSATRQPATINHRLSVLSSFFSFLIRRDTERGGGPWYGRTNPIPGSPSPTEGSHRVFGRDAPVLRRRGDFRRRVPRHLPRRLTPELAENLIHTAVSWRDKAILTLLYRTGQRLGDWSDLAGRHGVLGMKMTDVDERSRTVTVRLKGDRDEHRVPVTDDFWPLFRSYLSQERRVTHETQAIWIGLRRGKGKPLTYGAFESSLRYMGRKIGANVHAHMFRHTLAQALVENGDLKTAQDILRHRHLTTTADTYARTDEPAMAKALAAARTALDIRASARARPDRIPSALQAPDRAVEGVKPEVYVFPYDQATLAELDRIALPSPERRRREDARGHFSRRS